MIPSEAAPHSTASIWISVGVLVRPRRRLRCGMAASLLGAAPLEPAGGPFWVASGAEDDIDRGLLDSCTWAVTCVPGSMGKFGPLGVDHLNPDVVCASRVRVISASSGGPFAVSWAARSGLATSACTPAVDSGVVVTSETLPRSTP